MVRNLYYLWKVIRLNIDCIYIYMFYVILKLENIFNMVFFIGILCLIYDLDIDL